jgi:hypothetical protein
LNWWQLNCELDPGRRATTYTFFWMQPITATREKSSSKTLALAPLSPASLDFLLFLEDESVDADRRSASTSSRSGSLMPRAKSGCSCCVDLRFDLCIIEAAAMT